VSADPTRIAVALAERSYDVVIGKGLLAGAGKLLKPLLPQPRLAVVTDETVASLHLPGLLQSLGGAGFACTEIVLPAGEASKDFTHLEALLGSLLEARIERGEAVLALGGGVIGDLAGLAASLLRRGVDVIQAPTTLLAQVDSAIGGKTGINTRHGKNLVGTFHQPRLVLCDTTALDTLPERDLRAGYAEVVKYGLLGDADFFAWLEEFGSALLAGDAVARRRAVIESCRTKARLVAADEREGGARALLNLGHTFAHALEAEAAYGGGLTHGEAVAVGLCLAFELSARLELAAAGEAQRVSRHLTAVGLPTEPSQVLGSVDESMAERLLGHMRQDKKVQGGRLVFVLARGIGDAFVNNEVPEAEVLALLTDKLVPTSAPGSGDLVSWT
jgi:3-dehydroquinate synthase